MARESEADQKLPGITRISSHKRGYDVDQVDAFLDEAHAMYDSGDMTLHDIQNAAFELVDGGYSIAEVDAALARLGRAVVDKQTANEISRQGKDAWLNENHTMYATVSAHAERAPKERFARGRKKKPSYDLKQVDRLVDMVLDKLADELNLGKTADKKTAKKLTRINSVSVANSIFTQHMGERGYDERQVDYYLSYCIRLLSRLESYKRLKDDASVTSVPTYRPANTRKTSSFDQKDTERKHTAAPLFDDDASFMHSRADALDSDGEPLSFAPTVDYGSAEETRVQQAHSDVSFEDVHKVEEEIFKTPGKSSVASPLPPAYKVGGEKVSRAAQAATDSQPLAEGVPLPSHAAGQVGTSDTSDFESAGMQSDSSLASLAQVPPVGHAAHAARVPVDEETGVIRDAPATAAPTPPLSSEDSEDFDIPSVTFPSIGDESHLDDTRQ